MEKREKRKSLANSLVYRTFWRRVRDSNPRYFTYTAFRVLHLRPLGQLSIYVIPLSFEKLFARTDGKNNKIFNFQTEQKLNVYGETVVNKLPTSQKTSSQLRYDHFDTSPNYSKHYNIISLRNKNVKKNL